MDKLVLDAMNKGWALGLATRVGTVDADFEAARARQASVEPKRRLEARPGLRVLVTMLFWRRAQH